MTPSVNDKNKQVIRRDWEIYNEELMPNVIQNNTKYFCERKQLRVYFENEITSHNIAELSGVNITVVIQGSLQIKQSITIVSILCCSHVLQWPFANPKLTTRNEI